MNSNDAIRDLLLRTLYDFHVHAKSPKSAAKGIQEIQKSLRDHGYKQQEVSHNLDYLLQKGWVREVKVGRTFMTKSGTVQNSEQVKYKISHAGIDQLETASMYRSRPDDPVRMNITTVNGVTVVGDGNVVNSRFTDASRLLNDLRLAIDSSRLSNESKLDALADIDTVLTQLQKPEPNHNVLRSVWEAIQKAAVLANASGLLDRLNSILAPTLGGT